jgi:heterodisulfide reductase subunit A
MHATKEAMLAREHDPEVETYIFYTEFRAFGKGFQKYIRRGEEQYGINYIRGRVAEITEDPNQNLVIWYEDTNSRQVYTKTVDLAVLSTSLIPSKGVKELADILGVELDEYNFFKTPSFSTIETTRPGIFVCGYCQAPLDIPECVAQASGAASKAAEIALK